MFFINKPSYNIKLKITAKEARGKEAVSYDRQE